MGLLLISSLTAFAFLAVVYLVAKWQTPSQYLFPKGIRRQKILISAMLSGLLNPFAYYLVLFEAYDRLRAQEAQVLNYTWAIVLAFVAALVFRQKIRFRDVVALLISFLGVIIIAAKGNILSMHFDDALGTGLALGSSLVWALYWIMNMRYRDHQLLRLMGGFFFGSCYIAIVFSIAAFVGKPITIFSGSPFYAISAAFYVGIFEMGLTFVLWNKALNAAENTSSITNLIFITPFLSLVFIALLLGESIHPATVAGLILIVSANLYQKAG